MCVCVWAVGSYESSARNEDVLQFLMSQVSEVALAPKPPFPPEDLPPVQGGHNTEMQSLQQCTSFQHYQKTRTKPKWFAGALLAFSRKTLGVEALAEALALLAWANSRLTKALPEDMYRGKHAVLSALHVALWCLPSYCCAM